MGDRRIHLVIIEDVIDNLEVLQVMLESRFEVTGYSSTSEALAGLESVRPDLFLIDIGMSDIDGIECLRRIRSIPELSEIPAIAVTAFAYPEDRDRCLNAGFQAFVAKPVLDYDQLRALIVETLRRPGVSRKDT